MRLPFHYRRKRHIVSLFGLAVLALGLILRFFIPVEGVENVEGRAKILDGDSIIVAGREVRMQGIDAPEGRQYCRRKGRDWACGQEARRFLKRLIGKQEVFCKGLDIDKHDRLLALCQSGGLDLNREMVARGFAVSYGRYETEERSARKNKTGIWSSEFERPRDWRRDRNIGR